MNNSAHDVNELYQQLGPQLLAYFHRRHRNVPTAEDLLHETFATVLRSPDRLASAVSPRAYLFGVARNLSLELYRRQRRSDQLQEDVAAEEKAEDSRLELMREAIAELDPVWREVLEFRLQQELSYEEIASVLNIPVGTVRSRLHHAVKHLQKAIKRTQNLELYENRNIGTVGH